MIKGYIILHNYSFSGTVRRRLMEASLRDSGWGAGDLLRFLSLLGDNNERHYL